MDAEIWRITRRNSVLARLVAQSIIARYWAGGRHVSALVVLAYRFRSAIQRFNRKTISSSIFRLSDLRHVFRGFDPASVDADRLNERRLRKLVRRLESCNSENAVGPDPVTASPVLALSRAMMRSEFYRLLGLGLMDEETNVLAQYGSVSRALLDFLSYCGSAGTGGFECGFHWPTPDDLAGFVQWAASRHAQIAARTTLDGISRGRSRFSKIVWLLRDAQHRILALRRDLSEPLDWAQAKGEATYEFQVRVLYATRGLDAIHQKIELCHIANMMYTRALRLVLRGIDDDDANTSGSEAGFLRVMEVLRADFERVITFNEGEE